MANLTAKQERFVAEYLIDLNATQAAIRAGYSEKTATEQGSRLLTNVKVQEAIAAKAGKTAEKLDLSAERVLRGLFEEATRHGEGSSHGARVSAWGLLGKYHKLFVDRVEADVTGDLTVTDARTKLQSLISRQNVGSPKNSNSGGAN